MPTTIPTYTDVPIGIVAPALLAIVIFVAVAVSRPLTGSCTRARPCR